MGLTRDEQEIHISKSANEDEFLVYITDPIYIRKMEKIGVSPYKTDFLEGEIIGYYYKVPKKQIAFRPKREKREITEEQKQKLRDRLHAKK